MAKPAQIVGVVWYSRETYDEARRIMEDGHALPLRFDDWEKGALNGEARFTASGHVVVRAYIDPETFPGWCAERGFGHIDAEARKRFGTEAARRKFDEGH